MKLSTVLCLGLLVIGCSGVYTDDRSVGAAGEDSVGVSSQELTAGPCTGPVETTGSVGYQSQTRYISKIKPHATLPYALSLTWAINGVDQGTGTVHFGSGSGVEVRAGSACTTALGEVFAGTGDCADNGWVSQSALERVSKIEFATTFDANSVPIARVLINDIKYLEIWGAGVVSSSGPWTWTSGLTKWREDTTGVGTGPMRFWLDGYGPSGLESHFTTWSNNGCIGR